MFQGKIVGETTGDRADERQLGLWMANAHSDGIRRAGPGIAAAPAARDDRARCAAGRR